jgi:hypothetical protein
MVEQEAVTLQALSGMRRHHRRHGEVDPLAGWRFYVLGCGSAPYCNAVVRGMFP